METSSSFNTRMSFKNNVNPLYTARTPSGQHVSSSAVFSNSITTTTNKENKSNFKRHTKFAASMKLKLGTVVNSSASYSNNNLISGSCNSNSANNSPSIHSHHILNANQQTDFIFDTEM